MNAIGVSHLTGTNQAKISPTPIHQEAWTNHRNPTRTEAFQMEEHKDRSPRIQIHPFLNPHLKRLAKHLARWEQARVVTHKPPDAKTAHVLEIVDSEHNTATKKKVAQCGVIVMTSPPLRKKHATTRTTTATEKSMMTVSVSAGLPSQRRLVTVVPKRPNQKDNVALDNEHVFLTARGAVVKARSSHNKKSVMGKITTATAKSMS